MDVTEKDYFNQQEEKLVRITTSVSIDGEFYYSERKVPKGYEITEFDFEVPDSIIKTNNLKIDEYYLKDTQYSEYVGGIFSEVKNYLGRMIYTDVSITLYFSSIHKKIIFYNPYKYENSNFSRKECEFSVDILYGQMFELFTEDNCPDDFLSYRPEPKEKKYLSGWKLNWYLEVYDPGDSFVYDFDFDTIEFEPIFADKPAELVTKKIEYVNYNPETDSCTVELQTYFSFYEDSLTDFIYLPTISREHYIFDGWYFDPDFQELINYLYPDLDIEKYVVYAKWTPKTYYVRYRDNGGSGSMEDESVTYGDSFIVKPNTFTRKGYRFIGWSTESTSNTPEYSENDSVLMDTDGITLYALWVEKDAHGITYVLNGGQNNELNVSSFSELQSVRFYDAAREGYIFKGWYLDENFETPITNFSAGSYENSITVYAKWEIKEWNIVYNCDYTRSINGIMYTGPEPDWPDPVVSESNPKTYTIEDGTVTIISPVLQGFIFDEWQASSSFELSGNFISWDTFKNARYYEEDPEKNTLTLYAQYREESYNIIYVIDGEVFDPNKPDEKYSMSNSVAMANTYHIRNIQSFVNTRSYKRYPYLSGYSFNGWYEDEAQTKRIESTVNHFGDLIVYGSFIPNDDTPYSITYYYENAEDDDYSISTDHGYGTTDTMTNVIPKEVYGFILQPFEQQIIKGNGTTSIKVYYKRKKHTLTIDYGYGNLKEEYFQKYGSYVQFNYPERRGYTCQNVRYEDPDGTYKWPLKTENLYNVQRKKDYYYVMPDEDITLTTNWSIIIYSLSGATIKGTGSSTYFTIEDDIELEPDSKKGFVFKGFYLNDDYSGDQITGWKAGDYSNDVTVYSKFEYDVSSGITTMLIVEKYSDLEFISEPEIKDGYLYFGSIKNSSKYYSATVYLDDEYMDYGFSNGKRELSSSSISAGYHTIYWEVKDKDGKLYSASFQILIKK